MQHLLVNGHPAQSDMTVEDIISDTKTLLAKMPRDAQGRFILDKECVREKPSDILPDHCKKSDDVA